MDKLAQVYFWGAVIYGISSTVFFVGILLMVTYRGNCGF